MERPVQAQEVYDRAAVLHFKEMRLVADYLIHKLLGVVYLADGGDGVRSVVRAHKDRLRLKIRNTSDSEISLERAEFRGEFSSERCVFNVMNCLGKSVVRAVYRKSRATGSEVGMIVCSVEQVEYAIFL